MLHVEDALQPGPLDGAQAVHPAVEVCAAAQLLVQADRELKCYLKEGLKVAQWQCLPFQAANQLVHLAEMV